MPKSDNIKAGDEEELKKPTGVDEDELDDEELDDEEEETPSKAGKGGAKGGKKDKMVMVSAETLQALMDENRENNRRIDALESNAAATLPGGIRRSNKKETKIKVRFWNGRPVVAFENMGSEDKPKYVYSEYNPQTRESVEFINIVTREADGKDSDPIKLNYVQYLRESEVNMLLMKRRIELEDGVEEQGIVYKKGFAENGYGMFETTLAVPVEVITKHYQYEVIVNDKTGETLTVDEHVVG